MSKFLKVHRLINRCLEGRSRVVSEGACNFSPVLSLSKNTADQAVRVLDRYGMVVGNGLVEQGLYGRLDAVFPHIICIFVFIKRSTFINQIALFEQCFCL